MAEDGEDKLIAVARHIARTIGRTDAMTDDIIHIFSTFDRRFSAEKLAPHPHHSSPSRRSLRSLDRKITAYITSPSSLWSNSSAPEPFLSAVDDLIATRRDLDDECPSDHQLLSAADELLSKSMLRLEDEFTSLLLRDASDASSDDEYDDAIPCHDAAIVDADHTIPVANPVESLSPGTISDLYQIAKRMVAGGFGKICAAAYARSRIGSLQDSLSRGGFNPRPIEELQTIPWPELDAEVKLWIKAAKMAFRTTFPGERRLCRRVFGDLTPVADLSFLELCRDPALQLLALPRAVGGGSRAPERLFRVVDLYECLHDLIPEIALLFSDPRFSSVRSESAAAYVGLRAAIREIFAELEDLIRRDPARDPFPGAGVHPITRYVLNYLRAALGSSWNTLAEVMRDDGCGSSDPDRPCSSLKVQIGWIMEILLGNLEAKSKLYRDPSQGCVFLMNNVQYVVSKVKGSELEVVLGEDWLRRQMAAVRQWHAGYQRHTWGSLIAILQTDGGSMSNSKATKEKMREKMRRFVACFEEICKSQKGWAVVDEQLKAEMRIAAAGCSLPAYRNFLSRMAAVAGERGVKYSSEDVERRIGELFQGAAKKV